LIIKARYRIDDQKKGIDDNQFFIQSQLIIMNN
jgi:hypothetical protein